METLIHRWAARLHPRLPDGKRVGGKSRPALRVLTAVAVSVLASACGDLPTEAAAPTMDVRMSAVSAREVGTETAVCTVSEKAVSGPYAYEYSKLTLKLPRSTRAPEGGTQKYQYRGYASGNEIVLAANCLIPNTEKAVEKMNHFFGVVVKPEKPEQPGGASLLSGDNTCSINGCTATVCQYGGEYPDCKPRPDRTISIKDTAICYDIGCDSGTEPTGGGGDPLPPSQPQPDPTPCATGNPVIDDPAIQGVFQYLWDKSNYGPDVPMKDRREQGGWIIRKPDGSLQFQEFPETWARMPCGIDAPPNTVPPADAIGWLHTHPMKRGEEATECEWQSIDLPGLPPGFKKPITYTNDPSSDDDSVTLAWQAAGHNVAGYMIDADKVVSFTGGGTTESDIKYPRCGFNP